VALTVASIPLWLELSLVLECRVYVERALASQASQSTHSERDELKLLMALGVVLPHAARSLSGSADPWAKTLALAEKLGDEESQGHTLCYWAAYRWYAGDFRGAIAVAEKCSAIADKKDYAHFRTMGNAVIGSALHHLGDHTGAFSYLDPIVNQPVPPIEPSLFTHRLAARSALSSILWVQGFPDQAVDCARIALDEARTIDNALILSSALARTCPIGLYTGNLVEAERSVAMLLDYSTKHGLDSWNAVGRCLRGTLLLAQNDFAGLAVLRTALDGLREANFAFRTTAFLSALAEGLTAAGQFVEAHQAIDEALERTERNEERWCMAELLRIKGDLVRSNGSVNAIATAEDYFQRALDWSRRQDALSWELRAATSLAKLWRQDGKTAEADELLSAVYNRFTEGFDTVDLRTARALIDKLRETPAPR
jgi:predicted ATPase